MVRQKNLKLRQEKRVHLNIFDVEKQGYTYEGVTAKIYNALLCNHIETKIDNILRKNQNGFQRNRSTTSQILTICQILEGVRAKNL